MFKIILIIIFFSFSLINISKANFDVKARTAILQDYFSGEILYEKEPDISIYPASMTKIMTAIIAFDLIKTGRPTPPCGLGAASHHDWAAPTAA